MPADSRRASSLRRWRPRRATHSTWQARVRYTQAFSMSPRTNTSWWRGCTTSLTPFARDLGVAYASRSAGAAPGWAELPVQYADYALWQRTQLGDADDIDSPIGAQLAFWEKPLGGMPERLQLPTDRPYPPVADHQGARVA